MKRAALLGAFAFWLAVGAKGVEFPDPDVLGAALDGQIPAAMEARSIPGAVITVVDTDRTLVTRAYGVANVATGEPVHPERTLFRVASVSKIFTATAAMQLVERGVLDLDADVNDTLASPRIAAFDHPLTLRHLLTHTAGFGPRFLGYTARTRAERLPLDTYMAKRLPRPFIEPGQIYSYANHGIALAGWMIAETQGSPFPEAIESLLLAPLGMHDSHFAPPEPLVKRLATGYVLAGDALHPVPFEHQHATPAGSLVTTAPDMTRFLRLHLNGGSLDGRRILRPETVAAMHRRQFSHHPRMQGVGLGFHEYEIQGWRCIGHDGDTGGFNSRAFLVPELGIGLFLSYTGSDQTKRFADEVMRLVLEPVARPQSVASLPREASAADLDRFSGTYRWTRYDRETFGKGLMAYTHFQFRVDALADGALQIAPTPLPVFPTRRFESVGESLFQADDGSFATFRGDDGRITHLLFNPSGVLPMAFERIPRWRSASFQIALIGLAGFAWPVFAIGLAVALWRRRLFESELRRTALLALVAALANTAFLTFPATTGLQFFSQELGLPAFLSSPGTPPIFFGPSLGMLALLALPLTALAVEAVVAVRLAGAWRRGSGGLAARIALTTLVSLGVGFALLLNEWNLLGYRL